MSRHADGLTVRHVVKQKREPEWREESDASDPER
jgi:hypothetical protein